MRKRKAHLPENYLLTEEEQQDLRDAALEALARMEERSGIVVPLARNEGTPFTTAKEAWEARKRERDRERRSK